MICRNCKPPLRRRLKQEAHGPRYAVLYPVSPCAQFTKQVDMAARLQDMGVHSICIERYGRFAEPYVCEGSCSRLKENKLKWRLCNALSCDHRFKHCQLIQKKPIDAGYVDNSITSISSMSILMGIRQRENCCGYVEGYRIVNWTQLPLLAR